MVTPDGQVKLLDFGLGKVLEPEPAGDISNSPTMTAAATMAGVLMGTAAYMSPEQMKGPAADKRSDVWAFGCVLYEMLTGRRAFEGADVSDTLAAILRGEPDWSALPPGVPPQVAGVLRRCLEKDRRTRVPDISAARYLMDETTPVGTAAAASGPLDARRTRTRAWTVWIGAPVLVIAGAAASWWLKPAPLEPHDVARFRFALPDGQVFTAAARHTQTLSPDGAALVYIANQQLHVRFLNEIDARPIAGTNQSPAEPVFSPDGQWVAYLVAEGVAWTVKKVSLAGGAPVVLAQLPSVPLSLSWTGSSIVFAANTDQLPGIQAIPDSGGPARMLVALDGQERATQPQLLDGGKHVMFVLLASNGREGDIVVQDVGGKTRRTIIRGGSDPHLLPTGHLLYIHEGNLFAVAFDANRLEATGGAVPLLQGVMEMSSVWTGQFAVSRNGTLVYRPGNSGPNLQRRLVWLDRQGHEERIGAPQRAYQYLRLSPDGTRVSTNLVDDENDIWIFDLARETLQRLTFGRGAELYTTWTPDSHRIIFATGEEASLDRSLQQKAADGTGSTQSLGDGTVKGEPQSVSPDGKWLVYRPGAGNGPYDLKLLPLDGGRQGRPLLADPKYNERNGEISPDGRWIAYETNESGQYEVVVRPFPNVDDGRWQVSSNGGSRPLWARSGRELFFIADGRMMAVSVGGGATFAYGKPQQLFDFRTYVSGLGRTFDIAPDGKRFLALKDVTSTPTALPSLVVVTNWFDEIKAKIGR